MTDSRSTRRPGPWMHLDPAQVPQALMEPAMDAGYPPDRSDNVDEILRLRDALTDTEEKLVTLRTRLEAFAEGLGRHHARGGRSAVAMAKLNMSHMIREMLEES